MIPYNQRLSFYLLLLLLPLHFAVHAQKKWKVDEVPNPKSSPSWNYISDPDDILSAAAKDNINQQLKELEQETTNQVAVVLLKSIGETTPRRFAIDIFRKWGVGTKEKNNGVLVLLVMDQRRMEFEVGYGLEGTLTDLRSKQIQEDYMVPLMKRDDYDAALIDGVSQLVVVLSGKMIESPGVGNRDRDIYAPVVEAPPGNNYKSTYKNETPEKERKSNWFSRLFDKGISPFMGFTVLLLILGMKKLAAFLGMQFEDPETEEEEQSIYFKWFTKFPYLDLSLGIILFLIPGDFGFIKTLVFIYGLFLLRFVIFTERSKLRLKTKLQPLGKEQKFAEIRKVILKWPSVLKNIFPFPLKKYLSDLDGMLEAVRQEPEYGKDNGEMELVNEQNDDQYLNEAQRLEESLASVDYDVWIDAKGAETKVYGFEMFSDYVHCPECNTVAYKMVSDKEVNSATYTHSGKGLRTYKCEYCKHIKEVSYIIPQLQRSGSSSGGSSSSSSSSSSRSSGSSFGGGSSGGGGAGSSW